MPRKEKSTTTTTIRGIQQLSAPLRRSPRLNSQSHQTPITHNRKSTKILNHCSQERSTQSRSSKLLGFSVHGPRRSPRFTNRAEEGLCLRRSARISSRENTDKPVEKCDLGKSTEVSVASKEPIDKESGKNNYVPKKGISGRRKMSSCAEVVTEPGESKETEVCKRSEAVSRKRKRGDQCSKVSVQGWTREQEIALQRAYFTAKPTPNFWKKVSKLVPGKSAQDCFDKVHSDHMTPPQPMPRSRAKTISSPLSCFSLSASKLLNSSAPKTKRYSSNKQKSHLVHKTLRQLLQKCNRIDQDYEADLFYVLEPNVNPSTQDSQPKVTVSTPKQSEAKQEIFDSRHDTHSGPKKPFSRFSSRRMDIASPPVLKRVKSRALHEKYIDQLHSREAKREAAFARAGKSHKGKENREQINMQKVDVVRAAKNALVLDAKDAVKQLQDLQANATCNSSDLDDDCVEMVEDEGEIEL